MENLKETKVSKIVAQNYKTAKVFSTYGIDFCCNGGIPLSEACASKNVEIAEVLKQLEVELAKPNEVDYQAIEMPVLIDHIVETHHHYVEKTIPILNTYLNKLCQVHGERHPELFQVFDLFRDCGDALTMHMKKEELTLFPFINKMVKTQSEGGSLNDAHFGHINNPISMMEAEHAEEGARFEKIAELTNQYTCPPDGCQTYRVAYAVLKEFENDLHKHIHLENNILFPKAAALYQKLNQTISA